jgi:small multidrug resistance pump
MGTIIGASVAFSIGSVMLRPSAGFTRLAPSIAAACCFLIGAALMARALLSDTVSAAVVLGLGIEAVVAVSIGLIVLGERITMLQGGGIALVVAGVALLR